ncbi:SAGA complex subunit spt3 [Lasiodiplodia theobromae]|uniref:SAGA complex subunit spt3 n=1 Tax=Lasiodiplodia theobromae TaxID=45133 RepID=A0A5N5CUF2_9PEZI|nr:SAGA complex subunit spt3 [Lasiodiplodia theobromae]
MVERIVQQQVTELLSRADALAARRGSRIISSDDLIFLIRDDKDKVSRLLHFLSWKELRKNAKDRDDKGGGDVGDLADADADVLPLDGGSGGGGGGDPASRNSSSSSSSSNNNKTKSTKILLPWDVANLYNEHPPPELEAADEQSQQEDAAAAATAAVEADSAQLRRLRAADERTQAMTRAEYAVWAEARQASFTRRRKAKFREWSGLGTVADARVGEDVMDILGFLTFQMVVSLTEKALGVKEVEEEGMRAPRRPAGGKELGGEGGGDQGLFAAREGEAVVVGVRHVGEAFRRLQREGGKGAVGGQRRKALRLF